MGGPRTRALSVLQDIWQVSGQTAEDLPQGHGKTCKNLRHVGFDEVDDDLRTAWRAKLEREGKLGDGTLADLLAEHRERSDGVLSGEAAQRPIQHSSD